MRKPETRKNGVTRARSSRPNATIIEPHAAMFASAAILIRFEGLPLTNMRSEALAPTMIPATVDNASRPTRPPAEAALSPW